MHRHNLGTANPLMDSLGISSQVMDSRRMDSLVMEGTRRRDTHSQDMEAVTGVDISSRDHKRRVEEDLERLVVRHWDLVVG